MVAPGHEVDTPAVRHVEEAAVGQTSRRGDGKSAGVQKLAAWRDQRPEDVDWTPSWERSEVNPYDEIVGAVTCSVTLGATGRRATLDSASHVPADTGRISMPRVIPVNEQGKRGAGGLECEAGGVEAGGVGGIGGDQHPGLGRVGGDVVGDGLHHAVDVEPRALDRGGVSHGAGVGAGEGGDGAADRLRCAGDEQSGEAQGGHGGHQSQAHRSARLGRRRHLPRKDHPGVEHCPPLSAANPSRLPPATATVARHRGLNPPRAAVPSTAATARGCGAGG